VGEIEKRFMSDSATGRPTVGRLYRLCTQKTWLEDCILTGSGGTLSTGREIKTEIPVPVFIMCILALDRELKTMRASLPASSSTKKNIRSKAQRRPAKTSGPGELEEVRVTAERRKSREARFDTREYENC
jgi:hypothetical protein